MPPTTPPGKPDDNKPAPVDPDLLEDYATQQAFKEFLAEREAKAAGQVVPAGSAEVANADATDGPIKHLEVPIPDGKGGTDRTEVYTLVDIDRDVIAHLSMLTTLADTDMDKAQALFEAMLLPEDYVRLRRHVKLAARAIRQHAVDTGEKPITIEELWRMIADAVAEPLQELQSDPKRLALLRGPSRTGPTSKTASTPVGLPSTG